MACIGEEKQTKDLISPPGANTGAACINLSVKGIVVSSSCSSWVTLRIKQRKISDPSPIGIAFFTSSSKLTGLSAMVGTSSTCPHSTGAAKPILPLMEEISENGENL